MDYSSASAAGLSRDAREGHEFIGVTWSAESSLGDGWVMAGTNDEPAPVRLVVDGEKVVLGDLHDELEEPDGAWVAVPEGADQIDLEVEFDGLVQTVEDLDLAGLHDRGDGPSLLYLQAPYLSSHSLGSPLRLPESSPENWTGGDYYLQASTPLPWMAEMGWAPEGSAWLPVDVFSDAPFAGYDTGDDYASYEVRGAAPTVRLDGAEPVRTLPTRHGTEGAEDGAGWSFQAVFEVDEHYRAEDLVVRREFVATAEQGAPAGAPRQLRRTAVFRTQLPGY